jgi:hypothetical protein
VIIAKSSLNRFYDEGYCDWSETKLKTLFNNNHLKTPEIARTLENWETNGWVKYPKSKEKYLIMLNTIPD